MFVPLIHRSLRWKMLVYVIGFIFVLRLAMMTIEYAGDEVMIDETIAYLDQAHAEKIQADQQRLILHDLRTRMDEIKRENAIREFLISIVFFGLIIVAVMIMARHITRPIAALTQTARELAGGHFDAARKLDASPPDEVGELSRAFAVMAEKLAAARELEKEVVRAAAIEQERIAHDLHDSVGQLITGLAFKAKLVEAQLRDHNLPAPEQAAELVSLANRAGEQIRALARGIDPVELQDGLVPALQYLAVTTAYTFGVQCDFKGDPLPAPLEKSRAIHLYRIAQEAVSNAIKHSKARQIMIELDHQDRQLVLTITDNGCGMIRRPIPADGSGLRIMHYRARMIGGTLDIQPRPACGLLVKCTIQNTS